MMPHNKLTRFKGWGRQRFGGWFIAGVFLLALSLLVFPQVLGASEPDDAAERSADSVDREFPVPPPPESD